MNHGDREMPRRVIAIGDIHGCSVALATLIGAIDPGPDDVLVPLGDYIDRGPDSRGVLDQVITLRGRCTVVPLGSGCPAAAAKRLPPTAPDSGCPRTPTAW